MTTTALTPAQLRFKIDPTVLDFVVDKTDKARPGALGQDRALRAIDLGLGISERGFNLFVVGAPGTGRTSTVRSVLKGRAKTEARPDDWCLLYNFEDADHPTALPVAAGRGLKLKRAMEHFVERLEPVLLKAFEADSYERRRDGIAAEHERLTDETLKDVREEAERRGFLLRRTQNGITLGPVKDGEPLTEEAYDNLPSAEREELEEQSAVLEEMLEGSLRGIRQQERDTEEKIRALDREVASAALQPTLDELFEGFSDVTALAGYFAKVKEDILDSLDSLRPSPEEPEAGEGAEVSQPMPMPVEDEGKLPPKIRYAVNVLVDNSRLQGAPVIEETHPTPFNLLGRIEHRMRGGETVTDFTRIKPGALHKANGGYLLVDAIELMQDAASWEGLKRALKNRELEFEDPGESGRMISIASLRPEPIPLNTKIIVIGTPDLYYLLSRGDQDFRKLFKVKVDFDTEVENTPQNIEGYGRFLCALAREENLLPLERSAVGRAIEHAARLASRRDKLSTQFGQIADLLREASFYARQREAKEVAADDVRAALDARTDREAFLDVKMREDIDRGAVRIDLAGAVTGQINGLTVVDLGSYSFGHPARVTATVGLGSGDLLDIERETELGGPIHTKGILILTGFLTQRFGLKRPLRFEGRIAIEQNYMPIDGDSASLAETCALLSALSGVPIQQRFAITGSMDQLGQVQVIGGTNEKIEGFFKVCKSRGLDGQHGAIIPATNMDELMLSEEIVEACEQGLFHIYAIDTLEEAMSLLCGLPYGEPAEDGSFAEGTIGGEIEAALDRFEAAWREQRGDDN